MAKINFSEDYLSWLDYITHNEDKDYYKHLLKFSNDILLDSLLSGGKAMQDKLRVNAQQLSTIKKLLEAYND